MDLPNYDNFVRPGTAQYPDHDSEERYHPFDCEWDFLHFFNDYSLEFDWMSQPMGNLSTDQPPEFPAEPWPNQLDMSLIGTFNEPALPANLEQPLFMPTTTLGQVHSSIRGSPSDLYTTQNASAPASSMSSDFLSIPSTQETPFRVSIPQNPDTTTPRLCVCNICAQSYPNSRRLKRHQKQHLKPITCPASATCTHRTAEKRDMTRHVRVHHPDHISVPQYLCPEPGCEYAIKGFGRQDNLVRHMRRRHRRLA